jgi:hypothetical protein
MNRKLLWVLGWVVSLCAFQGRDFSGTYTWSHPIDQGEQVSIRLAIEMHNSGADVVAAAIEFRGQADDQERHEYIAPVSCRHGEIVKLSRILIVSKREFTMWRSGRTPRMVIQYLDNEGNRREQILDLTRELRGGDPQ